MHTPVGARKLPITDSSPLSTAPATSQHTPTGNLGNAPPSSSPMYTPCTEGRFLKERATQKRLQSIQTLKNVAVADKEAEAIAKAQELEDMKGYFDAVLDGLEKHGYSLADLMEYVFNPETRFQSGYDWRWRGFFAHKPVVQQLL